MGKKDPRVDAYIAKAADFAKPILNHIRELVHTACPDAEETMKWSFPHFDYKGMLCSMAAFKQHCAFGFWKEKLILGARPASRRGRGSFGRITSLNDLPDDKNLVGLIRKAVQLNDAGVKISRPASAKVKRLSPPAYFMNALQKNKKALTVFENFSYSNKKDYLEWVTEAKSEKTRNQRLATSINWMAKGKVRNWEYLKKTKRTQRPRV
jgi:hypothetical protein